MPYVNVYLEDRAYGGPEEGGWYYTDRQPVKTIPVTTYPRAERAIRLADIVCAAWNQGRPPISSVCSRGRYVAFIERQPGQPTERPHYE